MERLGEVLRGPLPCPIRQGRRGSLHSSRRARSRAPRGGCARRRGSRRSTRTGSRAGPSDDPGESDPGDDHSPLVAGKAAGAVR
jgi:hypothetical protein